MAWHTELFLTPTEFASSGRPTAGSPCARSSCDTSAATGCPIRRSATTTASRPTCSCSAGNRSRFSNISQTYSPDGPNQPRQTQPLSLACNHRPSLAETCEQILREQEPNFLRLYLNPHVAQTCFCLDRYVSTTWTGPPASRRVEQARAQRIASRSSRTASRRPSAAPSSSRDTASTHSAVVRRALSSTRPIASPASLGDAGGRRASRVLAGPPRRRQERARRRDRHVRPGTRCADHGQRGRRRGPQSARTGRGGRPPPRTARGDHPPTRAAPQRRLSSPASTARAWPRFAAARAASFARLCPTSSSSTNRSSTMPFPSAPSPPASRCSLAGTARQGHVSLDDLSAQYDLDAALHELSGRADPEFHGRYRDGLRADCTHRPIPTQATAFGATTIPRSTGSSGRPAFVATRRSRRRLVRRCRRPLDLRCRGRSRVQLSRPQSRHLR